MRENIPNKKIFQTRKQHSSYNRHKNGDADPKTLVLTDRALVGVAVVPGAALRAQNALGPLFASICRAGVGFGTVRSKFARAVVLRVYSTAIGRVRASLKEIGLPRNAPVSVVVECAQKTKMKREKREKRKERREKEKRERGRELEKTKTTTTTTTTTTIPFNDCLPLHRSDVIPRRFTTARSTVRAPFALPIFGCDRCVQILVVSALSCQHERFCGEGPKGGVGKDFAQRVGLSDNGLNLDEDGIFQQPELPSGINGDGCGADVIHVFDRRVVDKHGKITSAARTNRKSVRTCTLRYSMCPRHDEMIRVVLGHVQSWFASGGVHLAFV